MIREEEIPRPLEGERLDRVVTLIAGCSRSEAARWLSESRVWVNGEIATERSRRLAASDRVVVDVPEAVDERPLAEPDVDFGLVHVDDDLIVVNKPAGLVVHPGPGHPGGTLVNGLLARFPEIATVGQPERPGIVHRLDRGTSGALVVARSQRAYEALVASLAAHLVLREYLALVSGHPSPGRGVVDAPVGRSLRVPTRMTITASGKPARTHYEVLERFEGPPGCALLKCELETGRTHQIRVHLSGIAHPVVGDKTYGGTRFKTPLDRPFLHARALGLTHPTSGEDLRFEVPLPADLVQELERVVTPAKGLPLD